VVRTRSQKPRLVDLVPVTLSHVTLFESVQQGGAKNEIVIPIRGRAVLVFVLERGL
jgi:hypothetical protein